MDRRKGNPEIDDKKQVSVESSDKLRFQNGHLKEKAEPIDSAFLYSFDNWNLFHSLPESCNSDQTKTEKQHCGGFRDC